MRKLKLLWVFVVLVKISFAQKNLSLIELNSLPSTVQMGQSFDIIATLVNNDSQAVFQDTIDYFIKQNQSILSPSNSVFSKPLYSGSLLRLQGGESVPAYFRLEFDPQLFVNPGQNTVVIWPMIKSSNNPFAIQDSIVWSFNLIDPNGIDDESARIEQFFTVNSKLYLPLTIKSTLQEVRIFDIIGNEIYYEKITSTEKSIDISKLSHGIYIAYLSNSEGNLLKRKFIY